MRRFLGYRYYSPYSCGHWLYVVFSLQEVLYVCIFQYKGKHVLYHMVTSPIKEHNTLGADQKEESREGEL